MWYITDHIITWSVSLLWCWNTNWLLDFVKAFNTVPHKCLLYKLEWYGIRGNINHWISSFLNNCTQRIVLGGVSFPECSVLSGVPQSTVPGPTLFSIYTNDLPESILYSSIKLFADDCILYKAIRTPDDVEKLQEDLSAFQDWQQKWLMKLNVLLWQFLILDKLRYPHLTNTQSHLIFCRPS